MLLIILLVLGLAAVAGAFLRLFSGGVAGDVSSIRKSVGASRCIQAEKALRRLAEKADSDAIVKAWNALESPLLSALPDCPPDLKPELAADLERCATACANRQIAQSMMTLRNSLMQT